MQADKIQFTASPRTPYQSIDLGILMFRRWWKASSYELDRRHIALVFTSTLSHIHTRQLVANSCAMVA